MIRKIKTMNEMGECCLCKKKYTDYGHNPNPLAKYPKRCCEECNRTKVIPARLRGEGDWE